MVDFLGKWIFRYIWWFVIAESIKYHLLAPYRDGEGEQVIGPSPPIYLCVPQL
jgi:hypothetical protein